MAINFKYDDEDNLTARERLQLAEERKRNFQQQMADSAHERFMAQHRNYMERNPNAYSVAERMKVFGDVRQGQLMQHEKDMLGQKGRNEQLLQREKNEGLVDVADSERQWREKQAEAQLEGTKYAEDKKLEGIKDTNQTSILNEKERQMGQLNVENARQKGQLDVEKERQKGTLDVETKRGENAAALQKGALESQERQVETQTSSAERIAQVQAGKKVQMTPAQESQAAQNLMKQSMGKLTYEQALAQVRAGASGQQDGEAWPGYTAEKTAELKRRGYTLVNGKPVKNG